MTSELYPAVTRDLTHMQRELAPGAASAFNDFSRAVFADGALSAKIKNIIAVAAAHVTQCPYCIRGHTRAALRGGASPQELMEAIWVAAEMRAGAAFAHSVIALSEMSGASPATANDHPQHAPAMGERTEFFRPMDTAGRRRDSRVCANVGALLWRAFRDVECRPPCLADALQLRSLADRGAHRT